MPERYPHPENWHRVRFNDEVHLGYGIHDKLRIVRKAGMRAHFQDCIEEVREPTKKDNKKNAIIAGWLFGTTSSLAFTSRR